VVEADSHVRVRFVRYRTLWAVDGLAGVSAFAEPVAPYGKSMEAPGESNQLPFRFLQLVFERGLDRRSVVRQFVKQNVRPVQPKRKEGNECFPPSRLLENLELSGGPVA
jgi:hypothetical protein